MARIFSSAEVLNQLLDKEDDYILLFSDSSSSDLSDDSNKGIVSTVSTKIILPRSCSTEVDLCS